MKVSKYNRKATLNETKTKVIVSARLVHASLEVSNATCMKDTDTNEA